MEATPGFEPGIRVLQTRALPLGYVATMPDLMSGIVFLARVAGFEPANDGIRIRCLTAWLYPISNAIVTQCSPCIKEKILGWMVGFEPTNTGATTQGLNHLTTPTAKKMSTGNGLEPSTSSVTGWHSNQLNYPAAKWWDQ